MDARQHVVFDKGMTGIVKGFAIVFMLILHCYSRYNFDVALDYSHSLVGIFAYSFKICVGIFVFLVGYGYAFSKTKDFKYGLQHIKRLLIPFWTILFVFTLPFCFDLVIDKGFKIAILNLIGIDATYNYYSWFVYFYIFAMCVMPFISRFIDKKPVRNTILVIILSYVLMMTVHEAPRYLASLGMAAPSMANNKLVLALFNSLMMTPGMAAGYLFARQGYYERIRLQGISKLTALVACPLVIIGCIVMRHYTAYLSLPFDWDLFYAPLVVGAIAILFNKFEWPVARKTLTKLGELSVYMWFFHALFFTNAVRWFYQPAITIFEDVNLVFLWTITITFFASWIIKICVDAILRKF